MFDAIEERRLRFQLVQGTQVTDTGLAHLTKLTKLRQLLLTRTQVTESGIAELKNVLPTAEIEK
ncbi:MAG: hypothetical protein ACM3U2_23325 [Deltaproteobacteria bacterium]